MSPLFVKYFENYSAKFSAVAQKSFDEELGKCFAEYRRGLSISQEYLSDILRRDQAFISKVETGKRTLSLFDFLRLVKALNLSNQEISSLLEKLQPHVE